MKFICCFPRLSRTGVALLFVAGMGVGPVLAQGSGEDVDAASLPGHELTGQILYQTFLAEVAGARAQPALAAQSYLDLARRTGDPRLARRAAEMALRARQPDLVNEAARLWMELDPRSTQAQQLATGMMSDGPARVAELQVQLAKALAQQGERLGSALLSLNRGLSRIADKALVRRLVHELTEPYLAHAEAHFARANAIYNAEGNAADALAALQGALRIRPDWEQAVVLDAQLRQSVQAGSGAPVLRAYLAAHPESREARVALARLLVADRQFPAARSEFERLLQSQPDDVDALHAIGILAMQAGDNATAERHFRTLIERDFPDSDTLRMHLGRMAEEGKRPDEALDWYRAVTPGNQFITAQAHVAQMLVARGRMPEARQHLQALAARFPQDRAQYVQLESQVLRDANRPEEALALLDEALRSQPDEPDLLYESALLSERLGRIDAMEARLRKLIALKPDHAHAYNALGYSLAERNLRLDEAEALVRKALSLTPADPFIIDSLGWVYYRRGNLELALEQLQKAFGLRPDPEIAAHLGEVLWALGRKADAARIWRESAQANPDSTVLADVIKKFKP